jgi:hypothetical protein
MLMSVEDRKIEFGRRDDGGAGRDVRRLCQHAATRLFAHRNFVGGASSIGRTYDLSPDGSCFLMFKPPPPPNIAVILNWAQTLAARSK